MGRTTTSALVATQRWGRCLPMLQHEAKRTCPLNTLMTRSRSKFTETYGTDLRYTAAWGRWSVWDGACWKQDQTLDVFDMARKVCRAKSASCENERLASRIGSAVTVAAIERLARADRRHAAII